MSYSQSVVKNKKVIAQNRFISIENRVGLHASQST
jgi:hypothetical protein